MLSKTGAFQSPTLRLGRVWPSCQPLGFTCPVTVQHARRQQSPSPAYGPVVEAPCQPAVRCSCSASTRVSQADSTIAVQVVAALDWQADQHCQNTSSNGQIPSAVADHQQHWSRVHAPQLPWAGDQHIITMQHGPHHSAADAAGSHEAVFLHAAASGVVSAGDWRILQLQDPDDELSAQIVSCSTVHELLSVASGVRQHGNKLQVARLVVKSAMVVQQHRQNAQQPLLQVMPGQRPAAAANSNGPATAAVEPPATAAELQLLQELMDALLCGTSSHDVPALLALSSRYLAETLYALQQFMHCISGQHQLQHIQQQVADAAGKMPPHHILPAVHACSSVEQLLAVVSFLHNSMTPGHTKAAFVQLARLERTFSSANASSPSGSMGSDAAMTSRAAAQQVAHQLMQLLKAQQQQVQLQPHAAASILWSLGVLQPLFGDICRQQEVQLLGQQLLEASLAGLHRLNHRVCAMMLHGAARLQLQLPSGPDDATDKVLQHTQQLLQLCDPQALSTLLWAFAELQLQPSSSWMEAFYSRSLQLLQPLAKQHDAQQAAEQSSSRGYRLTAKQKQQAAGKQRHSVSRAAQQLEQPMQHVQQQEQAGAALNPQELAAILSAIAHLDLQSPPQWLMAAACSCHVQLQQFGHQELALVLWSLAKLQHQFAVPEQLIQHAGSRLQQLLQAGNNSNGSSERGRAFSPNSLALLLYAVVRLQLQPQDELQSSLWQCLQSVNCKGWQQVSELLPMDIASQQQSGAPAAFAASGGSSTDLAAVDAGSVGRLSAQCAAGAYSRSAEHLQQASAYDLALLVWGLANQQKHNKHHKQFTQRPSADWVAAYMACAAKRLQQGQLTSQGLSMMAWGLGTVVGELSCSVSSSDSVASKQQLWATARTFWAALEQQTVHRLSEFSCHELANLLWGAGALAKYHSKFGLAPSSEWADLLGCQCLDGFEQLSSYQLMSVLQGCVWLKQHRGLHILQQILSDRWRASLKALQPQEVLILLRACVYYKHTPDPAAFQQVLAVLQQQANELSAAHAAQVLYLLGKMQQQHIKWQNKLVQLQSRAAKPTGEASHSNRNCSSRASDGTAALQGQQGQQPAVLQPVLVVPAALQCDLASVVSGGLSECSVEDVKLLMWGLSQLAAPHLFLQLSRQQQEQQQPNPAAVFASRDESTAANSSDSRVNQVPSAATFSELPAGNKLLQAVYSHSLQHIEQSSGNDLAMLLHAVHNLGVLRPPVEWLNSIVGHLSSRLGQMPGQGLAVLIVALSGFNWVPSKSWLSAYVDAVLAAEAAGRLKTEWQQAHVQNSLCALDPVAGQNLMQRRKSQARSSRSALAMKAHSSSGSPAGGNVVGAAAQAAHLF